MCLVQVLTTRRDKTLIEEGSERSTKGDSEIAPLLAMSRMSCPKKNGRKNGRHLWEILKAMKGVQGHSKWGQNIATVGWGAAIAREFQSHWQRLWKKSLPRAL